MTEGPIFVGIDGGGSKTDIVMLSSSGAPIAQMEGPSSNMAAVGFDTAAETLQTLISRASEAANVRRSITAGWMGLAGCDRPSERDRMQGRFRDSFESLKVTSDAELVLAGTPSGVGIALIGGTGSIAFGRNERGDTLRSGGWGHIFGDEGSGYGLAVAALRALAADTDGRGPSTALTRALTAYWGASSPQHLIPIIYHPSVGKSEIGAAARVVDQVAAAGDPIAKKLLESAADDLVALVESLTKGLQFDSPPAVALTGGLLTGSRLLQALLAERLDSQHVQLPVQIVEYVALSAARWTQSTWAKGEI